MPNKWRQIQNTFKDDTFLHSELMKLFKIIRIYAEKASLYRFKTKKSFLLSKWKNMLAEFRFFLMKKKVARILFQI